MEVIREGQEEAPGSFRSAVCALVVSVRVCVPGLHVVGIDIPIGLGHGMKEVKCFARLRKCSRVFENRSMAR
jgi:hypothetical protein